MWNMCVENCSCNSRHRLRYFVVAMDMGSSLTNGHRRNKMQKLKASDCKSNSRISVVSVISVCLYKNFKLNNTASALNNQ